MLWYCCCTAVQAKALAAELEAILAEERSENITERPAVAGPPAESKPTEQIADTEESAAGSSQDAETRA